MLETIVYALSSSVGFMLAMMILAYLRERIAVNDTPEAFKGAPMSLITLGIMSIAFMGFAGL